MAFIDAQSLLVALDSRLILAFLIQDNALVEPVVAAQVGVCRLNSRLHSLHWSYHVAHTNTRPVIHWLLGLLLLYSVCVEL